MVKTTKEMAEELGLNKENVELGLKKEKKGVTEAIEKAYAFMNKGKRKK